MVTITTKATKRLATCKKERNHFSRRQGFPKPPLGLLLLQPTCHCGILCEQMIASEKQARILQITQITPKFPHMVALLNWRSQTGSADLQPDICDQSKEKSREENGVGEGGNSALTTAVWSTHIWSFSRPAAVMSGWQQAAAAGVCGQAGSRKEERRRRRY